MKKTPVIVLLIILCISDALAINITMDIKNEFFENDLIYFNYTIVSDTDIEIQHYNFIDCPYGPVPFYNEKKISLKKDSIFSDNYTYVKVTNDFEPQTCTAYIQILSPIQIREEKNFSIITNPSFSFELKTCKDSACTEKAKVFIKNEDIYIDFDSEVPEPIITATLTLPDKTTQPLSLPTSIKAEQTGTYELDITASKQGYKTITKKEMFGVIEEPPNIPFVGICNANGRCEAGETPENCPQDCKAEKPGLFAAMMVLVLIIIIALVYFIIVRKK